MRGLARRVRPGWAYTKVALIGAFFVLVGLVYYFWHLGSLTPGLGPAEYLSRQNSQSLTVIIDNGLNAPYYALQHLFSKIDPNSIAALRLSSVVFGLVVFACLFVLLRGWFGKTSAFFAGLLFISTGWLVVMPRNAGPIIMNLWPIVMLAFFIWTSRAKRWSDWLWICLCAVAAIGLYVPGVIWLIIGAVLLARGTINELIKRIGGAYFVSGLVLTILMVIPLGQSIILEPSHAKGLLLVPSHLPRVLPLIKSIGWSALALFWQTPFHIDTIVDHLPILSFLQTGMCIFGIYALVSRARRLTFYLIGLLVFAVIVSGLNNSIELLGLGLVSLAVFMAAGLRYLYIEWRRVFPLNPFSYGLAIGLISVVVAAQMLYGIRYGLVAWPHTEATKSTYVLK